MGNVSLRSYAKINLFLDIKGMLPNGYHTVQLIMQSISLHDNIYFKLDRALPSDPPITVSVACNDPLVPCDNSNIICRAAEIMHSTLTSLIDNLPHLKLSVYIDKSIPVSAGLAGGSGNAAAVIKAFLDPLLWEGVYEGLPSLLLPGKTTEIKYITSVKTGADVLYCMHGGTMLAEGYGEILTPVLPEFPSGISVLLIKPPLEIPTKWAYEAYDNFMAYSNLLTKIKKVPDIRSVISAVSSGDLKELSIVAVNRLEIPVIQKYMVIQQIKNTLKSLGADFTLMSGSGSTVFGLFDNNSKALNASRQLNMFPDNSFVYLGKTLNGGVCNRDSL